MRKGKAKKGMKMGNDDENMHGGKRMPLKMPMHTEEMDKMMGAKKKKSKKKKGY